ncbi:hypothetical protein [Isachenkonia alkalipeptolytica]|uniref:Uncharacterized protein n=1 Tax=Isachenkonia alkalipeptolytica TaxID=2565777 RepID=A0AA43XHW1_9CLOT|nr:hypothetical protein [Isachenkonia alkalipeptolytica]NBG87143.1 hypothetical protein [Isachenkonia alkalipeptolytica]
MGKSVLVKVRNNIAILTIICSLAMLFLYIVGYFTTLHPDAYRDLVRSILLGYGIYLAIFSLYNGVYGKLSVRVKGTGSNRVRSKTVGKIKESPSEAICIIFMIITFLNSLMMLTGFDTPKEGTYA